MARDPHKPQNRAAPHVPTYCDLDLVVNEVASATFAKRQKLVPSKVKEIWESLFLQVAESLKEMKGVLIPTLGTFHVGRIYDNGKLVDHEFRPTFRLLEGRFAGVTQAKGRYRPAQKGRIVQTNFHHISRRTRLLRATCQRVVRDLLVQLGIHIVAGHQIKVEFPHVGHLETTKKGALGFVFEAALLSSYGSLEWDEQPAVNLSIAGAKAKMVDELGPGEHLHPGSTINDLRALCEQQDRIRSGCVPRLMLERWLQRDVRGLTDHLDAAAILDLLAVHTYGKSGRFILYPSFIDALEKRSRVMKRTGRAASRASETSVATTAFAGQNLTAALDAVSMAPNVDEDEVPEYDDDEDEEDDEGAYHATPGVLPVMMEGADSANPSRPGTPGSYYLQYKTKLNTRKDVDDFNKNHFARLHEARKSSIITPKVGADPLNLAEVAAMRHSLEETNNPLRRPASPDLRRRIAGQTVRHDVDGVLVPIPRPVTNVNEQEELAATVRQEKEVALAKKLRIRDQLQQSWEVQEVEKAKVDNLFRTSEERWPFGPTHRPEDRKALGYPRVAVSTQIPAPMA